MGICQVYFSRMIISGLRALAVGFGIAEAGCDPECHEQQNVDHNYLSAEELTEESRPVSLSRESLREYHLFLC